jgi:hypothetical protein
MLSVRRWYIYLVSGISLQSVTWAVIFLLRNLIVPQLESSTLALAFFIAVIVIGLPIYIGHWLWAQRLANNDLLERAAIIRRVYLYGMMAVFLLPLVANIDGFIGSLLRELTGIRPPPYFYFDLSPYNDLLNSGVAIVVLGLLWFYHKRTASSDAHLVPDTGELAAVRRLYIYTFAAAGLIMTSAACLNLLMWIMYEIWGGLLDRGPGSDVYLVEELARFVVGLPLWLIFWSWAQRLFRGGADEERASALRKLYLYLTVFLSAIYATFMITMLLSDAFRMLFSIPSLGEPGSIRSPLASILLMVAIWAYHTFVLSQDMVAAGEGPRQAQIRRLYYYLMAAIGLTAFLIGIAGDISILIDGLSAGRFDSSLRDQASWFTAALIAGLPIWFIPWRRSQKSAADDGPIGEAERQSIVRKIYLYLFLFAATIAALGFAIYIVAQIVDLALGGREAAGLLSDLAQAIAFTLIAVLVWFYHSYELRSDGRLDRIQQSKRLTSIQVTVIDGGEGIFGRSLIDELSKQLPDLTIHPLGLNNHAVEAMGGSLDEGDPVTVLADSDVIVGPWNVISAGVDAAGTDSDILAAINASAALKLIIPTWGREHLWAGVDHWDDEALIRQTVHALKQIAAGEKVTPTRPLGGSTIVLIVGGVLILAGIVTSVIVAIFSSF